MILILCFSVFKQDNVKVLLMDFDVIFYLFLAKEVKG